MRRLSIVVTAVLVSAGCVGGSSDSAGSHGLVGLDDSSALLQGIVVNEEILPLAGADVAVLETGANTTTDEAGAFTFALLPGTTYTLSATILGYHSRDVEVFVGGGDPTSVSIVLTKKPSDFPYQEIFARKGFWVCGFQYIVAGLYCASSAAATLNQNVFNTTVSPGWNETVYEQVWNRNAGITLTGRAYTYIYATPKGNKTQDLKETIRGTSPLKLKFYPGFTGHQWIRTPTVLARNFTFGHNVERIGFTTFPHGLLADEMSGVYPEQPGAPNQGVGATLQQPFELFSAQFYYQPSPPGYTSLPDR